MRRLLFTCGLGLVSACAQTPTIDSLLPDGGASTTDAGAVVAADAGTPALPDAGAPPSASAVFIDPTAPADSAEQFEAASAGGTAPRIVYPLDGVLVPPNIVAVDIHFEGHDADLFLIEFQLAGAARVSVYTACNEVAGGCIYQPSSEVWDALVVRRRAEPFEVVVHGLSGAERAASASIALQLADQPVTGGLYYWTTEPPAIERFDFELGRRSSETFVSETSEGHCVGCHALSHSGEDIAVGGFGTLKIYGVASRRSDLEIAGNIGAYSPDDSQMVVDGLEPGIAILNAETGDIERTLVQGEFPDWAPSGDRIAYQTVDQQLGECVLESGEWACGTGAGLWGISYPAYSPDSAWIVMRQGTEIVALERETGRVQTIDPDGTWPKWNPNAYLQAGHALFWFTYSTTRAFGLLSGGRARGDIGGRQIWMAAFDPTQPDAPMFPPFRVPAQRLGVSNFIGQWTTDVVRRPCADDSECEGGEFCQDGFCIPELI